MIKFLNQIRVLLTPRDKRKLVLIVLMMTVAALMELVGIGVLLPVAAVFLNPAWMDHEAVRAVREFLGIADRSDLVLVGIGALAAVFTVKTAFSFWVIREQARFIYGKQRDLSVRLYRNYLDSPYPCGAARSVAEWNAMLNLVEQLCHFILIPLMTALTDALLVIALTAVLLAVMPWITLAGGGFMALVGAAIFFSMKRLNGTYGKRFIQSVVKLARSRFDGLSNYKYLKLGGAGFCIGSYSEEYRERKRVETLLFQFGQAPRLLLEWSTLLLALAIFAVMVAVRMPETEILLRFSLLVAVMARMLPSFSRIHYSLTQIRQNGFVFDELFHDLTSCPAEEIADKDGIPATLDDKLELRHVTFGYTPEAGPVIRDFSLTVKARECVALVGRTGCGTSTLSDLVMGLRRPDAGEILADGKPIQEHLKSWRGMIGYVPQTIYLADDTVRNNIAFGVPTGEIDDVRVRASLEAAQLLADVEDMPDGLDTPVGENGAHLSGGQRQRLAIARALYREPRLLILDEATSALDNATEAAFVEALEHLRGRLTMLVIAHRLSTVENCDRTVNLDA